MSSSNLGGTGTGAGGAVGVAKPRARRASRAPLAKSMSVDETVLSTGAAATSNFGAAGRPSSMLARVSSSSSAVINTQNAVATKMGKASSNLGKDKENVAGKAVAAGPRRVLGDLSNAAKQIDQRSSKETGIPSKVGAVRVRSNTATLSSKPLAPKSNASVSANAPVAHSRSTSAASRHSVISQKSSHASLQSVVEAPSAATTVIHRRSRTTSDNVAAPGAPRIGAGNWSSTAPAAVHAGQDQQEELLDTVEEGDSYEAQKHGLGIDVDPSSAMDNAHEDNAMETVDVNGDSSNNETFELDLDQHFDDSAVVAKVEAGSSSMQVDAKRKRGASSSIPQHGQALNKIPNTKERDPEDWLALRTTVRKEAERRVIEVQKDYKEELDMWDTSMVAEYSDEIFAYMEELEIDSMPNPNYMDSQTEIEWPMRTTLIDWLLQVHMRYHMLPETLWITINIVDRFLSNRIVSLVKLQLVGITAMFVAAKYEEIMAPSVDEFVYMTENNYSREEILKGERIILASLDFKISNYCSPYSWVRRISKADDYDIQTRTLSKFLMEVTLHDHRFLRAKPSLIAAVGMYLSRRMLGGDWSEPFIYYSKFTEAQLATPTSFLLSAIAADDFEERFVYQKYSSKKFLKASIFARQWAVKTLESATKAQEMLMK